MTNYEKIKNMSVEEMAELSCFYSCAECPVNDEISQLNSSCKQCFMQWLNKEVSE